MTCIFYHFQSKTIELQETTPVIASSPQTEEILDSFEKSKPQQMHKRIESDNEPVTRDTSPVNNHLTLTLPQNCLQNQTSLVDFLDRSDFARSTDLQETVVNSCSAATTAAGKAFDTGDGGDDVIALQGSGSDECHVTRSGSFNTTFGDMDAVSLKEISRMYSDVLEAQVSDTTCHVSDTKIDTTSELGVIPEAEWNESCDKLNNLNSTVGFADLTTSTSLIGKLFVF